MVDQLSGAVSEASVHDEREVRRHQEVGSGGGHGARHPLAAPVGVLGHGEPLAVAQGLPCLVKGLGNGDFAVLELRAEAVAVGLRGEDLLHREIPRLGDDQVDRLPVELRVALVLGEFFDVQLLVKDEIDVSAVRKNLSHGWLPPVFDRFFEFRRDARIARRARRRWRCPGRCRCTWWRRRSGDLLASSDGAGSW
jgi:hypothetical protein